MSRLPVDPFHLAPSPPVDLTERRSLTLFGAPAEAVWLPSRRRRRGRPGNGRPPFLPRVAPRILVEETVWSDEQVALTPNLHPFGPRHALLWSRSERREAGGELLLAGFDWADRSGGAVLANSIGAAASIPWAHLHLVGETASFLPSLAKAPAAGRAALLPDDLATPERVEVHTAAAPVPCVLLAVTAPTAVRAHVVADLLSRRSSAAFNLVDQGGTTWLMPRSAVETPAPEFPQAFGAAELWGRWCFDDEQAFRAATDGSLERAFAMAGRSVSARSRGPGDSP